MSTSHRTPGETLPSGRRRGKELSSPSRLLAKPRERTPRPTNSDPGWEKDLETLREVVDGLNALEERVNEQRMLPAATQRGYLTPDEEAQVRQMLLSYRNLRLAGYDLILRYADYAEREPESQRLEAFVLAFATALTLYSKSLRIIRIVEHAPLLRAKLNEPEPRADLEAGFFDDVLTGYSSLSNYRLLREADQFWRHHRRLMAGLGFHSSPSVSWVLEVILRHRLLVRNRLLDVLWQRLRKDWREFVRTVLRPARHARYGLQAVIGETFAQARTTLHYQPGITDAVLAELEPQLQCGDILLVRTEKKVTTALLPGFWAHAAIVLGSEQELAEVELGQTARQRMHASSPHGYVLEAVAPRVEINPLHQCLAADHVLVLRPNLAPDRLHAAVVEALSHYGKPYDFEFDFTLSTRVVCTGLVYRAFHGRGPIHFELIRRLGRFTLSGDDVVNQALDAWHGAGGASGSAPLHFVALALHRRRGGVRFVPSHRITTILNRIRKGWRPLGGGRRGRLREG